MPASSLACSPKVLLARCASLHHFSSSLPRSRKRASPVIVVEMEESADVLRFNKSDARDERVAAAGGLPLLPPIVEVVGGRCETQSCTSILTRGLERRFWVFRDWAFVVIIIVGP